VLLNKGTASGDYLRVLRVLLAGSILNYIALFLALLTTLRTINLSDKSTNLTYFFGLITCLIGSVLTLTLHAAGNESPSQQILLVSVTLPSVLSLFFPLGRLWSSGHLVSILNRLYLHIFAIYFPASVRSYLLHIPPG
jgi:hypothetical protein